MQDTERIYRFAPAWHALNLAEDQNPAASKPSKLPTDVGAQLIRYRIE